jgi:hypothetical protein
MFMSMFAGKRDKRAAQPRRAGAVSSAGIFWMRSQTGAPAKAARCAGTISE